ncbi:unnamed protein product [Moneuplotes crassus]|uniref:Uncharacterized protein n=1 Tax=Euplotes crassus TaxID=5936 RepID=A0AAD1U9Y1_EUPCR|nr:unnamed protein product [Moneuplotes crassus]
MIRERISKIIREEAYRKKFFNFLLVVCIIGFIWTLCIGKVATRIGVNDLGLKGVPRDALDLSSGIMNFIYKSVDPKFEDIDPTQRWDALQAFLANELKSEAYIVPYTDSQSGYEGKNLISYIRSPRGKGNQCNLLAFPVNDINSISVGLGLIYHFKEANYQFLHKDTLVLFYESTSYSLSTKNFIKQYLSNSDLIKGRCGTIRHAFTVSEFKEKGKTVSVISEGKNYNMNDQNLIWVTKIALEKVKVKYDMNYPYSFSKNKFWRYLLSQTSEIRASINSGLKEVFDFLHANGIDIPFALLKNPIMYLDSLKNQLFGNLHYPHNDFLENGIYSITFVPPLASSRKAIQDYIQVIDTLLLRLDEIDTHEHSGTTQYFYADLDHHVTMQTMPYSVLMFLAGLGLPLAFKIATQKALNKQLLSSTIIKALLVHGWGFAVYHISNSLLSSFEGQNLCYPFEHLDLIQQKAFFSNLKLSLLYSLAGSTAGFIIFLMFIKLSVPKSDGKVEPGTRIEARFVCFFLLALQTITGLFISPAFCIFTSLVFCPLYGMKFNFLKMSASQKLRQFVFIVVYCCVLYCLGHFNYTPRLKGISRIRDWTGSDSTDLYNPKKISLNIFGIIGELYRDQNCAGNQLLFLLWTCWIPSLLLFIWTRF